MNITEEQIKKIASQELDIKNVFPEVFNFTGWAKDKRKISENWLGYFENNILEYGINNSGVWFNTDNGTQYNPNIERPATHEEIKNALVKEAKRRGYEFDFYDLIHNRLWVGTEEKGSLAAFNKGTWAEVKKEPKYVLVSEGRYVVLVEVYRNKVDLRLDSNKEYAIISETKEKAEAMNVLLDNKYKLEEI
jgi:hypothetical protein